MKNTIGYFVLSFDTELAWGYYDKFKTGLFSYDGSRERQAIQRLLKLLDEYQITATWAIVGQLFYKSNRDCSFDPTSDWNGRYTLINKMFHDDHPLLFAPDIVEMIANCSTPQEIGCHGHTHAMFDEQLMTPERAIMEINAWKEAAKPFNIEPKTAIFPRNRIGYLNLFQQNGFICFRGKEQYPAKLYYLPIIGRVFRRFHYYLSAILIPSRYSIETDASGLINIRSSQWLFGFNRSLDMWLERLYFPSHRLQTLVKGVKSAAVEGKILHLWAHPCEFKNENDFEKLRFLLDNVKKQIEKGNLRSIGMSALTEYFLIETI